MSGNGRSGVFGAGLALVTLFGPVDVLAFCRSSSCQLGEEARVLAGGAECQRDDDECVTEGNPLHWASPCLQYAVQEDGSAALGLSAEQFREAIQAAFEAWRTVSCPGGGSPRFQAQFQGFVGCARRESVCGDQTHNVNAFMLHDRDWPSDSGVLGLTTPSGGTRSGLVVDADLELNSQDYRFAFGARSGGFALSDVLSHEIGHFLGLDHSVEEGALMSEDYQSLERSAELLTSDDIAGVCAMFPPGAPLDCPAPHAPAYSDCQVQPGASPPCELASMTHDQSSGACAFAVPRGDAYGWLMGATLLTALGRRRRSPPFATTQPPENA